MSNKELSKPFKYTSFIYFDKDEKALMQTYKEEIERLNKTISDLQEMLDKLKDSQDYIAHLEYFRNKLLFECPYKNFQQITILQCISIIEKGLCKQTRCKARLNHLAKFIFE